MITAPTGTAIIRSSPTYSSNLSTVATDKPEVTIRWDKVTDNLSGHHYYKLYYKKTNSVDTGYNILATDNSTYDGVITVENENTSYYIHGGLEAGTYYHYKLTANTIAGETSDTTLGSDGTYHTTQIQPFAAAPCNIDNDSSLLVYYDFNDNASDRVRKYGDGRYDLTLADSTAVTFSGSRCSGSKTAYFNTTTSYAYNDNFSSTSENLDNFTISMWVYPDADMATYASALSTADNVNNDNFQIADNGSNGIVAMTENKSQWLEGGDIARDNWTHVVAVKYADNNSLAFYINGVLGVNNMLSCPTNKKESCADNNSLTTFDTNWEKIKIGINRVSQNHWKGYIDEVKVYNRPLNSTEVRNLYQNDNPS